MLENLSFVLIGLSAIVAVVTFVGAHSSALPVPNISKAGCFFSVGLLCIGLGAGVYPPIAQYNHCVDFCAEAVESLDTDFGESELFVSPGRVEYRACRKGVLEAHERDRKAAEEAAGQPIDIEMDSDEAIHKRCSVLGVERCTVTCFEGPAEG